jgi:hypothetical protein
MNPFEKREHFRPTRSVESAERASILEGAARRRRTGFHGLIRGLKFLVIALPTVPIGAPLFAAEPSYLTIGNFFSAGGNEPWARRARGTPDVSLLRVQTNFLAQLFRTDFAIQQDRDEGPNRELDSLTGTVEWAFNRRMMLAVIGNFRWFDSRAGEDRDGGALAAFARFQLVDTASSSLALTVRSGFRSRELHEKDTTLGFALAGWHDMASIGLGRTGLCWHVQEETLAGPTRPGAHRNDLTYDLSLAKTWTSPDAWLGNVCRKLRQDRPRRSGSRPHACDAHARRARDDRAPAHRHGRCRVSAHFRAALRPHSAVHLHLQFLTQPTNTPPD